MSSRGLDSVAWRALAIATVTVALVLAITRFLGGVRGLLDIGLCGAFLLIGMGLADAWRLSRKNHHRHDQPDT